MKYRKMGSLPWEVSALGFGCMRLPTSGLLHRVNEKYTIEILRYGIDQGINYVDTAWLYHFGQSEQVLGKALQNGYRDKVHLVTKLPMMLVKKEEDFDKYLDQQLERLQTDYLDIYLFHMLDQNNFAKVKRLNFIEKMEKARSQGKIKHIGFSFHDTLPVFKEIIDFYPWDMTQIQYNYMDTAVQATTEGLHYAHAKGIAVVIMEPLKGGQLANPPAEALAAIAKAPTSRTPVDWALQFLWNRPEVACVLSGMGNRKMVEENCASADASGVGTLTPAENSVIAKLVEIYRQKIIVPCTACRYCMPCPSGVDIPQNFGLLNNKSFGAQGTFASRIIQWLIVRNYRRLAKNKKELATKKDNGRASLCAQCKACVPKCPQHIQIPDELEKVVAVFEKGRPVRSLQGDSKDNPSTSSG
jgi:predicted aldo/keto reductase-like oxidoreductase